MTICYPSWNSLQLLKPIATTVLERASKKANLREEKVGQHECVEGLLPYDYELKGVSKILMSYLRMPIRFLY